MGELNLHNLSNYSCTQFLETGTGLGTGLSYACKFPFNKLISIEIVESLYIKCKDKFKEDDRVILINDSSMGGLTKAISLLDESPCLFWLDAHFPGADFNLNGYDYMKEVEEIHMPLVKELNLIHSNRDTSKDVFILDDLQLYYPGPFELHNTEFIKSNGLRDISSGTKLYEKTHNQIVDRRQQGFLILIPKI